MKPRSHVKTTSIILSGCFHEVRQVGRALTSFPGKIGPGQEKSLIIYTFAYKNAGI